MVLLLVSGLVRLDDHLDGNLGFRAGLIRIALPSGLARVPLRAIRRGSGILRMVVRNMYNAAEAIDARMDFTVR